MRGRLIMGPIPFMIWQGKNLQDVFSDRGAGKFRGGNFYKFCSAGGGSKGPYPLILSFVKNFISILSFLV